MGTQRRFVSSRDGARQAFPSRPRPEALLQSGSSPFGDDEADFLSGRLGRGEDDEEEEDGTGEYGYQQEDDDQYFDDEDQDEYYDEDGDGDDFDEDGDGAEDDDGLPEGQGKVRYKGFGFESRRQSQTGGGFEFLNDRSYRTGQLPEEEAKTDTPRTTAPASPTARNFRDDFSASFLGGPDKAASEPNNARKEVLEGLDGLDDEKAGSDSDDDRVRIAKHLPDADELENKLMGKMSQQSFEDMTFRFNHVIKLGRHTKITPGGRVQSYSALVLIGNESGSAGLGYGKALTSLGALKNANADAVKNVISIPLYENRTLPIAEMKIKYRATKLHLRAAPLGHGRAAHGLLSLACDAFGFKDIFAKSYGSRNEHTLLRAFFDTVSRIKSVEFLAKASGRVHFNHRSIWRKKPIPHSY